MKIYNLKYKKVDGLTLQEVLITMLIIGVMTLIAIPLFMPMVSKAKSLEAQLQIKHIYNMQKMHFYMHSRYSTEFMDLDFEAPKTVAENGTANYTYEVVSASNTGFKARATAVTDFDGDGIYNVWEIDENGKPQQITKD